MTNEVLTTYIGQIEDLRSTLGGESWAAWNEQEVRRNPSELAERQRAHAALAAYAATLHAAVSQRIAIYDDEWAQAVCCDSLADPDTRRAERLAMA